MIIAIGCDHAGYPLKEAVKEKLIAEGHEVLDMGTNSTESVDYPIYGKAVGEAVASGKAERELQSAGPVLEFHRLQQGEGHSLCAVHFRGDGGDVPETQQCQRNCHGRSDDLSGAGF